MILSNHADATIRLLKSNLDDNGFDFNLRSCLMGRSQVLNTYLPALICNAKEELLAPLQRVDHSYKLILESILNEKKSINEMLLLNVFESASSSPC